VNISETVEKYMLQGLDDMRQSIDSLDAALLYMIVERIHLVIHLGVCKVKQGLSFERSSERQKDLASIIASVHSKSVPEDFFQRFFENIYEYSIRIMEYIAECQPQLSAYLDDFSPREMDEYRQLLQVLDRSICFTLTYRFDVVRQVGLFKKKKNMPPMSAERWQQLIAHKRAMAVENNMDADFVESLFDVIHQQSLSIEKAI